MLPTPKAQGYSAVDSLGLGGSLSQQVSDETEEERKKRMRDAQMRSMTGSSGSLATGMLLGGMGGTGI